MKSTRMMLCVGLALSMTSVATAGERSRGGAEGREAVRSSSVDTSAARQSDTTPLYEEIAPGTVKVTNGSFEVILRANGMMGLEEAMGSFDSVEEYKFATKYANGAVLTGNDDMTILADNTIWNDPSFVGDAYVVIQSVEDRMQHAAWGQTTINGEDVVMFVDGAIGVGTEQQIVRTTPTVYGPAGEEIAADGMIQFQD